MITVSGGGYFNAHRTQDIFNRNLLCGAVLGVEINKKEA